MIEFPSTRAALLQIGVGRSIRAGGTDLQDRRHLGLARGPLADLRDLADLETIAVQDGALQLGSRGVEQLEELVGSDHQVDRTIRRRKVVVDQRSVTPRPDCSLDEPRRDVAHELVAPEHLDAFGERHADAGVDGRRDREPRAPECCRLGRRNRQEPGGAEFVVRDGHGVAERREQRLAPACRSGRVRGRAIAVHDDDDRRRGWWLGPPSERAEHHERRRPGGAHVPSRAVCRPAG